MNYVTGKVKKTKNTYSIHLYAVSWLDNKGKFDKLKNIMRTTKIGRAILNVKYKLIG